MSTPAELGLDTPTPNDLIREGADNITTNAEVVAQLWSQRWKALNLPGTTDLNDIKTPGPYIVRHLGIANRPAGEVFGSLDVHPFGPTAMLQVFIAGYAVPQVWVRRSNTTGTAWDEWVQVDAGRWDSINLAEDADLNDIKTAGHYIVRNLGIANRPAGEVFGSLDVRPFGQTAVLQTFTAGYGVPQVWVRRSNTTGTAWDEWVQIGAAPEPSGDSAGAYRRDLLQQGLRARKCGTIGTGGRGVVALRFDDAAGDFNRDVLPLLVARGLPFTRVTTTDRVGNTAGGEDDTWPNIQQYCLDYGGEVFNHGKTHGPATGVEALDAEITGALATLRTNLPRLPIDCWTPPGGQQTGWDGYMPAKTISDLVDSYAGALILSHHALATGYLPDSGYQPLDGTIRDGQIHWTADIRDQAYVVDLIDRTMTYSTGVSLLWHANQLDAADHMSMSDFVAILDYIVAKRDAGELLVLTVSGMAVADRGNDYRYDMLVTHSGSTALDARVAAAAQRRGVAGSTVELTATITGTGGETVTSAIGDSTREHTIPTSGTLALRHCATIPLDVTNPLLVTIDAPTADAHLYAV